MHVTQFTKDQPQTTTRIGLGPCCAITIIAEFNTGIPPGRKNQTSNFDKSLKFVKYEWLHTFYSDKVQHNRSLNEV
jgi:hypothetical protein